MVEFRIMKEGEMPGIIGIGGVEGSRRITNYDIAGLLQRSPKVVERLMKRVGIKSRNWVEDGYATSDLAVDAVQKALKMADTKPEDIKAIWAGTMTPDYPGVPISPTIAQRIGAPKMGNYIDVSAACVGFLAALDAAYNNIASPYGRGTPQIVVGADTLSKFIDCEEPETFLLFGDGAGATIVDLVPDKKGLSAKITFQFGGDGSCVNDLYIPAGGSRKPASEDTLRTRQHYISMNGKRVKERAPNDMKECIMIAAERANIKYSEILWLIPHQANDEIMEKVAKGIGFPRERVFTNIHDKGNTSAASIPLAIRDAYFEGRLPPDELIIACSFGAGSECGAAILPTTGLPKLTGTDRIRSIISRI